jgi:LmbE family N-acetylglucosaminyl deacetylase
MDGLAETPVVSSKGAEGFLVALAGGGLLDARRVALVVAHPDDEAIGVGGQLNRLHGVTAIHATDGAPRTPGNAAEHGFASAAEYAFARACELERMMMLGGVPIADRFAIGLADQQAALNLTRLARSLARLFEQRAVDIVLTHAFEGGHPDHDAVAFAVHAAAELRKRQGSEVGIIEMPFYHAAEKSWGVQRFLHHQQADGVTIVLDQPARLRKKEMFAAHRTQAKTLKLFAVDVERFRIAPRYASGTLPNCGDLLYERYDWGMDGARWMTLVAGAALELGVEQLL